VKRAVNNWKVVAKIATAFGVLSIIFAAVSALLDYQLNTYLYTMVPAGFTQTSAVNAMLPFLLISVLSFAVAAITNAYARTDAQTTEPATEPQQPPTA
jgi:uncharacterized membrane protein